MNGYQISFFTVQGHRHKGKPVMVVTAEESERLFERLRNENVHLFYAKTPAEFGVLGQANAGSSASG